MVEGSKLLFSSSVRVSPPIKDNSKRNNCSFIACRSVSLVNVDYGLEEFFMPWTFSGKYAPPSHAFTWLRFVPSFHPHLMIKRFSLRLLLFSDSVDSRLIWLKRFIHFHNAEGDASRKKSVEQRRLIVVIPFSIQHMDSIHSDFPSARTKPSWNI